MRICTKCIQPDTRPGVFFNEESVCGACLWEDEKKKIDWAERKKELEIIANDAKKSNAVYDCAIGVSGGKDSTFQSYVLTKKYNLNPLAITHGQNWFSITGRENLENCLNKIDLDHIFFCASRKKINNVAKSSLKMIGDACWHCHIGAGTFAIQSAFDSFRSVRRRQELRGEVNGIAVYDDFAHHPTAIRETVTAIRQKHPGRRLIAVFEPRSNTSVLKIHQDALIDSFREADEVILTTPHRLELTPVEQQLEVWEVLKSLTKIKIPAYEFPQVEGIIKHLKSNCHSGDVVLIMSNGKFDNIHQRLLEEL